MLLLRWRDEGQALGHGGGPSHPGTLKFRKPGFRGEGYAHSGPTDIPSSLKRESQKTGLGGEFYITKYKGMPWRWQRAVLTVQIQSWTVWSQISAV